MTPPVGQPGKGAEKIPAPKGGEDNKGPEGQSSSTSRMPQGGIPTPAAQPGQVQINVVPATPGPATAPALQPAPAIAPPAGNSEPRPF
jgi:hypothetical protein